MPNKSILKLADYLLGRVRAARSARRRTRVRESAAIEKIWWLASAGTSGRLHSGKAGASGPGPASSFEEGAHGVTEGLGLLVGQHVAGGIDHLYLGVLDIPSEFGSIDRRNQPVRPF